MNATNEEHRGQDRPESIWDDPTIPAGNSPPLPAWPLWLSVALWGGWIVFLAVSAAPR